MIKILTEYLHEERQANKALIQQIDYDMFQKKKLQSIINYSNI